MATYSFMSPTLTITFTPQELALLARIQTQDPGAVKAVFDSFLNSRAQAFLQKDVSAVQTFLNTAPAATITQIMKALGIPQV